MVDKSKLAERIRCLEGLSADERSALLALLNDHKKYGLVWEDKPEDVEQQLQDQLPVLTEVVEKRIMGQNGYADCRNQTDYVPDASNHILIEGDNLHALTCLSYTHEGKIDVIYIDPPYNTGNKDFIYNDRFVDTEDAYRHSKWLSFMHKRLRIARRLLSDRGVIFISIDDNEQANLKLLCDEVFGEGNFVAQVIWERAYSPVNLKKHFSESHDYIICYANHINNSVCNGLPRSMDANERYSNPDNDFRGKWKSTDATVGPVVEDKVYPIVLPSGRVVLPPSGRCWVYSKDRFNEMQADNRIWFGTNGDSTPSIKRFLSEVKQGMTPMTIWKYSEVGHSQDAAKELKDIFNGEAVFTYPKPVKLINRAIQLYSNKNSIILDFFAGSGPTLHAVMQLNAEDGGHRQCILVTNNENGICENVTYERNRRVINGYTTPRGQHIEGLHNNNLRYYRTSFVPREANHHNRKLMVNAATDLLCIKNNCYHEQVMTIESKKMRKDIARWFTVQESPNGTGIESMLIVYEPIAIPHIVRWLKDKITQQTFVTPVKIYVFSDGSYAYSEDFADVLPHIELCALPEAIYQAYIRVLGKRKQITESHD